MTTQAEKPSEAFIRQMAASRRSKGWSQADMGAALAERKSGLDKIALAKIETGKRRVTLDEAFEIAAVLGVAPLNLMIPRERDGHLDAAGERVDASLARRWAAGVTPLDQSDVLFFFQESSEEVREALGKRVLADAGFVALGTEAVAEHAELLTEAKGNKKAETERVK